ncbi:hypothetical protein RAA17_00295 [Komagataeibacter rhaeticus]|nr:hypothetical protein [Komagataeibacter rhaeticus]
MWGSGAHHAGRAAPAGDSGHDFLRLARGAVHPKYVETTTERDKLVYRVKLRIDPATARRYGSVLKAGMTGDGYVRTDPAARWPAALDVADAPQ